jgi:hypothetical protein
MGPSEVRRLPSRLKRQKGGSVLCRITGRFNKPMEFDASNRGRGGMWAIRFE